MNNISTKRWSPLDDYTESPHGLGMLELRSLHDVWEDQKDRICATETFTQFEHELKREWAIETGLIERLYSFGQGITQVLITNGIVADFIPSSVSQNAEQIELIIKDHESALEHLFDFVRQRRELTPGYVKELHSLITQHQQSCAAIDQFGQTVDIPLIRGEYKQRSNNPTRSDGLVHQYCPPEHVASEMDRLFQLHKEHVTQGISPEVEAAWLHHRFTSIHPFQDGNGRVARAIASLVFLREGWFPLVVREKDRSRYITALEHADDGRLGDLSSFFGEMQKKNFVNALSIAGTTARASEHRQQIKEARNRLQERKTSLQKELDQVVKIARVLHRYVYEKLTSIGIELTSQLGPPLLPKASFHVRKGDDGTSSDSFYKRQILEVAQHLEYFADTRTYRSWVRLDMRDELHGVLLVAFHGFGRDFNGLLACSGIWFEIVSSTDSERETTPPTPLASEPFMINYRESVEAAKKRFDGWLEECATRAIQRFELGAVV